MIDMLDTPGFLKIDELVEKRGFFSEWKATIDGTWFETRSPNPNLPCFISEKALPKCRNFGSYLRKNVSLIVVKDYLQKQIYILRFNNPTYNPHMARVAFLRHIVPWIGNGILENGFRLNLDMLDEVISECYEDDCVVSKINMEYTTIWYSDDILKLSGDCGNKSQRAKAKQVARTALKSKVYIDDLRDYSHEYQFMNMGVMPTQKILAEDAFCSLNTVKKYGTNFYILSGENIKQRVIRARELHSEYTQQQIADLLKENKRTIRQYWKST
jgi:hypothetical protein